MSDINLNTYKMTTYLVVMIDILLQTEFIASCNHTKATSNHVEKRYDDCVFKYTVWDSTWQHTPVVDTG